MSVVTLRRSARVAVPMPTLSGLVARIAAMLARRRTDSAVAMLDDRLRADIGLTPRAWTSRPDAALRELR